jgi:tRNA pseudouridine32 synthase/23S rRNA pseudouridine746 synthase
MSSSSSSGSEEQKPDIPIIYESERMLVLNKPPGIAHHDDEQGPGIVTLVREQQGQRVWGVHRLDRVTSGILLMAKDEGMAQALTRAFANGEISKLYLGISAKKPTKKKQGLVQGRMVRSRDKSWKLTRNTSATATTTSMENYAKTRFFTAPLLWSGQDERGGTSEPEEEQNQRQQALTLILFRPYTGKTHQLRVAAKSMGLPLLGDPVYRDGSQNTKSPSDGTMVVPNRTYLHASGILVPALQGIISDPLALWCPPSFDQILGEQPTAISDLMQKRCDIPELLEAMKMRMEDA